MTGTDVRGATLAVARAAKAGDRDAELLARAELAMVGWRRQFVELTAAGVRLNFDQLAELHGLVELMGGRPTSVRFEY